ncbi:MAG: 4-hydroxy-tetrahydrodipicolinate synthase [Candidatus Omnitrophota bacterium]
MFNGSIVAIVTPFKKSKIDEDKLGELVEYQIKNATSGIVPCGTTGESPTLSMKEHERAIEVVIDAAQKRVPVIAGTGSNSTQEAIELSAHAQKAGADGLLLVSPYYNKPTQQGLYLHFKVISESVKIPIILYNIASRTGINIEPQTVCRLAKDCKNIIGIKEASGSLDQMSQIKALCPKDFDLISGDDSLTLPLLAIGGVGVVSVVANIVPADVAQMVRAFEKGDIKKARDLHYKLLPLIKAMFIETNPIPVKTAMGLLGLCEPDLRLPLCAISPQNLEKLSGALSDYGLLK